jgi:glycosyltransferase involved in cell wall biosynthesis
VIPALLWLIERLATDNEVFVYALRYHEAPCTYPLLGATVRDLGRPSGLRRQYCDLVAALRHDGPFEVLHGYWAVPAGLVTAAAARRLGVPSVVTCDSGEFTALPDIDYGLQRQRRHRLAVAAALKLATRVTVCTAYMAELARRHGTSPVVVPLGVNTAIFNAAGRAADRPPWRVLNVASQNPVKDHRTLIEAFRLVVDLVGDVHLDLAGEDTLGGAVHEWVRHHRLDQHVTIHGFLPSAALVPLYQGAHLFALSSRHEAAGVVALEAAACGLPIAGTAVGYVSDWSATRAVAVPCQDARALARAITGLLGDPSERRRLADSARQWAVAHDADWTAARFARLYSDLV